MKYVLPVLLTIGCVVLDHLFLAEMERGNHPKAVRLKGLASLCFVLTGLWFAILAGGGRHHLLIGFGLVLGLIGDVLLAMRFEYPEKHDLYFLIGAISFALGHVLYIAAMLGVNGKAWLPGLPFWVGLLAIAGVSALRCKADAGKMQIPGYGYIALVAGMGAIACGLAVKAPCAATVLFAVGGVLFVISDTILSCHCFGTAKDPVYNRWVHYTYYAAQLLIAWSLAF